MTDQYDCPVCGRPHAVPSLVADCVKRAERSKA